VVFVVLNIIEKLDRIRIVLCYNHDSKDLVYMIQLIVDREDNYDEIVLVWLLDKPEKKKKNRNLSFSFFSKNFYSNRLRTNEKYQEEK